MQGELDLFARALADLKAERGYAPKVLAITGTNGKTTTTAMTGAAGRARRPARGGRPATSARRCCDTLADALDARDEALAARCWVLELSSFQLARRVPALRAPTRRRPVLNVTQDHLDWHGTWPAYAAAKARIFGTHAR